MSPKLIPTLAVSLLLAVSLSADHFDFKDPKGVNHIIFKLDAPLEFISGSGKGISGTVHFDPAAPESTRGVIMLQSASTEVPNRTMMEHMHGEDWLNVASFPEIKFEIDRFALESAVDNVFTGKVFGSLELKGIRKPIEAKTSLTLVEDGAGKRSPNREGDLLVARSEFEIKLEDFGIELNALQKLKVAETVNLEVVLAGYEMED